MHKRLFIVCPFACLEPFLQRQFGQDIYFLTAAAAVLQIEDENYAQGLVDFLLSENIQSITWVNDTSCRFIRQVIESDAIDESPILTHLIKIRTQHYASHFRGLPLAQQSENLAKLSLEQQASSLMQSPQLAELIQKKDIALNYMITAEVSHVVHQVALKLQLNES